MFCRFQFQTVSACLQSKLILLLSLLLWVLTIAVHGRIYDLAFFFFFFFKFWLSGKESAYQCGKFGFSSWVRKIPWRRKWQPSPVFLPGGSHGQRSLVGYILWGCKESDITEHTGTVALQCCIHFCCTAKWISRMYTYIPFLNFLPI